MVDLGHINDGMVEIRSSDFRQGVLRTGIHCDEIRLYSLGGKQSLEKGRMRLAIAIARSEHRVRRLRRPAAVFEANTDIADIAGYPIVDSFDLDPDIDGIADNLPRSRLSLSSGRAIGAFRAFSIAAKAE